MRRKNWHGSRPESMFFELNTDRPDGEKKHAVAKKMRKMAAAAVFAFVTAAAFCTTGVRSYAFNLGPGMENYNIQIYQEQPENNPAYNNGWTSNIGPGGTGSNPGGGIDSEKDYAYSKGPGNEAANQYAKTENSTTYIHNTYRGGSWRQRADGKWALYKPDGNPVSSQWAYVDGKTYLLDMYGIMQTGWQNVNENWYYLNSKGAMQTGWLLKEGKYYFLNNDGIRMGQYPGKLVLLPETKRGHADECLYTGCTVRKRRGSFNSMKLKIGNVELENNVILAPMAGVTDMPYRILCREQGAGLVCMEMVSAKAILYKNKNTQELLKVDDRERPVSLQLFGSDPDIVADIAASLEDGPYDIFDINMGCPVPKIVKNGEGSALMKNPKLVEEILTKLVKAVKKPVTVKFRKGFDDTCINAVEIAKIAESAGVAAVAVHGRTREQYYSGKADWNIIREVKNAVKIPVIGNGDVFTPQDAKRLVEETGCDGIMVARGAKGNPWIFKQITHYLDTGELLPRPSVEELKAMILRHGQMMLEFKGELAGMREMRKHVAWYTAGYPNSAALRNDINAVATFEELTELIGKRL